MDMLSIVRSWGIAMQLAGPHPHQGHHRQHVEGDPLVQQVEEWTH